MPDLFRIQLESDPSVCLGLEGTWGWAQLRSYPCADADNYWSWRRDSMTFTATPLDGTW